MQAAALGEKALVYFSVVVTHNYLVFQIKRSAFLVVAIFELHVPVDTCTFPLTTHPSTVPGQLYNLIGDPLSQLVP